MRYPRPMLEYPDIFTINGVNLPIPSSTIEYLEICYGPDWRTPSGYHANYRDGRNSIEGQRQGDLTLACVSMVLFCIALLYRRWHSILLFSVVLCFVVVL
jgi:hypothetical protein